MGRFHLDVQVLAVQAQTGSPEERSRSHLQRMEQNAHLARFGCRAAVPLTLVAQRTGTAPAHARPRDHAQAAIGLSAVFMRKQLLARWATQGPIMLEGKILPRKATRFQSGRHQRLAIA
ncbi:MAG TPA: hypothetical protein VFV38_51280 [Ktedonobacteraceae bacterium]|nr:hypothetical protein [Ktedonobacteraceae bacterium]